MARTPNVAQRSQPRGRRVAAVDRFSLLDILVGGFILVASTGINYLPQWNYLTRILGYAMATVYVFRLGSFRNRLNTETLLYGAWLVWSTLAGFSALHKGEFVTAWATNLQILVMILIISTWVNSRRRLAYALWMFIGGATVAGAAAVMTGEWSQYASGEDIRVDSFASTNNFGFIMLLSIIAIAYHWTSLSGRHPGLRAILLLGFVASQAFCISSASRKAIISANAFWVLWILFCYRDWFWRRPFAFAAALLLVAGGMAGALRWTEVTAAGRRLERTAREIAGEQKTGGGIEHRVALIREGVVVARDHPILGVGLANPRRHFRGFTQYAHNDFVEVAAATGIVGLLLYAGIYVTLWRRTGYMIRHAQDIYTARVPGLVRAGLMVCLVMSLGRPLYQTKEFWILFSLFFGWSSLAARDIRRRSGSAAQHLQGTARNRAPTPIREPAAPRGNHVPGSSGLW